MTDKPMDALVAPVSYTPGESAESQAVAGAPWAQEAADKLAAQFTEMVDFQGLDAVRNVKIHALAGGSYRPGIAGGTLEIGGRLIPFGVYGGSDRTRIVCALTPVLTGERLGSWV